MRLLVEGGSMFMYPLLMLLFVSMGLFVIGLKKTANQKKTIQLLNTIGLFALIFGFLGQTLGLLGMFYALQFTTNVSPKILAGGMKLSMYPTIFGAIVFLITKIEVLVFTWIDKK